MVVSKNGFDGVVEELDAEGVLVGKGEDVDNAAAHGILARVHHEIHALEAVVLQHVDDEVDFDLGAFGYAEGVAGEGARRDHFFKQRFGIGDHGEAAAGIELLDHFAPLQDVGIVGGEEVAPVVVHGNGTVGGRLALCGFLSGLAQGGGEEEGAFLLQVGIGLVEHHLDVVEQVVGFLFVAGDDELAAVGLLQGHGCGHCRRQGTCHAGGMDSVAAGSEEAVDLRNYL